MKFMMNEFSRTSLLLGEEAMEKLKKAKIIIFGIGGVGSYTAEAVARSGIGNITLVDNDEVSLTNINRQIIALHSTVGEKKTEVMQKRIEDINPNATVCSVTEFYSADTADKFDLSEYDYIVDAIDTVSSKLLLIEKAKEAGTPIISCMGAGNKLDPTRFEVTDVFKTSVCPLAKVMRRELKARGIKKLKVVYSQEMPISPKGDTKEVSTKRQIPGSIAFVPSVAGLIIAGEVIKDIVNKNTES